MNTITFTSQITLESEECINCGTIFGMTRTLKEQLKNNGKNFFCPNGHSMVYGKGRHYETEQKLLETQKRVTQLQCEKMDEVRKRELAEIKLKSQTTRISNGVCPCCNRTFQNLARHMSTKHREYKK